MRQNAHHIIAHTSLIAFGPIQSSTGNYAWNVSIWILSVCSILTVYKIIEGNDAYFPKSSKY